MAETAKPVFTNPDGTMTEDGRALIEWMEAQFIEADRANDVTLINSLSGDIKHYYVNVYKMNKMTGGQSALTPEVYLRDYKNSFVMSNWRNFQYTRQQAEQKDKLAEATQRTEKLEAQLKLLQENLEAKMTELNARSEALEEAIKEAGVKKPRKAVKVTEDSDESEA